MDVRAHEWDLTPQEAIEIQKRLRPFVVTEDRLSEVKHVAGVDVGFKENGRVTQAAVAVLSFPDLVVVETAVVQRPTTFPYIPGLLSFREVPAILDALAKLKTRPDLILCDGQGIAHPRRFGLAAHLGVLADMPTIGVAKTRLTGRHAPLDTLRGSRQPLIDRGEVVGVALRTRTGVKPVYVSVGHRISLETAVAYVLRCTPRYRLPETTRQAHRLASAK
ncbi:MAG: deoxyribonuclease V [Chloroflexi bacterium]|nr:MAG: deoxyribonuclease V [Chloroflexota bacterium]